MKGTRDDAGAYGYEFDMLLGTHRLMKEHAMKPLAGWNIYIANAYLEAYLVHARNLIEFFLTAPTKDNISAVGFLENGWTPSGPHVDRLKLLKEALHKRLSHLTRTRHQEFEGYRDLQTTVGLVRLSNDFHRRITSDCPEAVEWFADARRSIESFYQASLKGLVTYAHGPESGDGAGSVT